MKEIVYTGNAASLWSILWGENRRRILGALGVSTVYEKTAFDNLPKELQIALAGFIEGMKWDEDEVIKPHV